jgi:hypothetical protein
MIFPIGPVVSVHAQVTSAQETPLEVRKLRRNLFLISGGSPKHAIESVERSPKMLPVLQFRAMLWGSRVSNGRGVSNYGE